MRTLLDISPLARITRDVGPNTRRRQLVVATFIAPLCASQITVAQTASGSPGTAVSDRPSEEVPFVVTPPAIVERMLQLAQVTSKDRLADLGSGDGRIVIAAAKRGAFARGYEIDANLVSLSKRLAARAGVAQRAVFLRKDIFDVDYSGYSVITMYLLPEFNLKLRPVLLKQLKPGARIVSHEWDMGDWEPDEVLSVRAPTKLLGSDKTHRVYLWVVPANIAGRWRIRGQALGEPFEIDVAQQYQRCEISTSRGTVRSAGLRGRALTLIWDDGKRTWRFSGELDTRGRLRGTVGPLSEETGRYSWRAMRLGS